MLGIAVSVGTRDESKDYYGAFHALERMSYKVCFFLNIKNI